MSSDESSLDKIEDCSIKTSTEEKLLEVKFDSNLSFENHVTSLWKGKPEITHSCKNITLHGLK